MSNNEKLIPQFKINTLTKSQYEKALVDGLINQDELYCVAESTDLELCERVGILDEQMVVVQGTTVQLYTHTLLPGNINNLVGSGTNGKFKATSINNSPAFAINGVTKNVINAPLVSQRWYTFIYDGTNIFFPHGEIAMPKYGGTFTGSVTAVNSNRSTSCLRNTEVRITSPTGALQATNSIIMVRK